MGNKLNLPKLYKQQLQQPRLPIVIKKRPCRIVKLVALENIKKGATFTNGIIGCPTITALKNIKKGQDSYIVVWQKY